jgi:hypothetical protein
MPLSFPILTPFSPTNTSFFSSIIPESKSPPAPCDLRLHSPHLNIFCPRALQLKPAPTLPDSSSRSRLLTQVRDAEPCRELEGAKLLDLGRRRVLGYNNGIPASLTPDSTSRRGGAQLLWFVPEDACGSSRSVEAEAVMAQRGMAVGAGRCREQCVLFFLGDLQPNCTPKK